MRIEIKTTNLTWIVSQTDKTQNHAIHIAFSIFVCMCVFRIWFWKFWWNVKHTSCERPRFLGVFWNLKIEILRNGIMLAYAMWDRWIFSREQSRMHEPKPPNKNDSSRTVGPSEHCTETRHKRQKAYLERPPFTFWHVWCSWLSGNWNSWLVRSLFAVAKDGPKFRYGGVKNIYYYLIKIIGVCGVVVVGGGNKM